MTWRGFRLTQSFCSDWLSLNNLQSFLSFFFFSDFETKKSLFRWKTQAALLSPVVYHPIIQNLHYKTAKTFADNAHSRRESSSLHQCHWLGSTDSSNYSSWISKISRSAWRTWREHVNWAKDTFFYSHFSDQNCTSNQTFNLFLYTPPASIKQWVLRATGQWPELGGSDPELNCTGIWGDAKPQLPGQCTLGLSVPAQGEF